MQYQVVEAESTEELTKKVTAELEKGWTPFGDLVVGASPRMFYREMMLWSEPAVPEQVGPEYAEALKALNIKDCVVCGEPTDGELCADCKLAEAEYPVV